MKNETSQSFWLCPKDCADRDQIPVRSGPWKMGAVAWAEVAAVTAQSSQREQSSGNNQSFFCGQLDLNPVAAKRTPSNNRFELGCH
jgi:hypothetical protein